ncbi:putative virion structural protein [Erwinia phage vB_EamM_RisingSun]|uniref:Putative virion structural protein n=1 Tax=Erwinia phage vB_EamM_RisingSun TaxID=2026080 RepID=A0A223LIU9_9CAUD|nr:virion structural protein [Erwinia phage vB_EamM_RisingSun]ASU03456.1 putative virion structural protein [Erwinia phage vB_EamM_RisingSun]
MSTSYLSFGSIAKLHNNSNLVTSPMGELSTKARTYTKDPGVFSITGSSETILYNFLAEKDNSPIVMPQDLAEKQITIANWLYDQANKGNLTASSVNCLNQLKQQFTNNIEILEVGDMVTNSTIFFPSFIRGNHKVNGEDQSFYLWFANEYFLKQYPRVSFTVCHPLPIEEMDTLMTMNYRQIAERLEKETPNVVEDRIDKLTNNEQHPASYRRVDGFSIVDLINTPNYNTGWWRTLVNGNGDDADDQLYQQIQDEILENSQYTREEWEEKIPDLFNPTEFYVIPYYDRLGVKNKVNGTSTLSPIVDYETVRDHVDFYLTPNMSADHVIKSLQSVAFLYKSFQCAFVGKLNNRPENTKLSQLYPDYQLIPSDDPDFDIMSGATMTFIKEMENLISAAETTTPNNLTPAGITRVTRFNKLWVSRRVGKVRFVVMTRWQMLQDGRIKE